MATHCSILAWRIPGMGEPGGLPSMGSHRVGHDWSDLAAAAASSFVSYFRFQIKVISYGICLSLSDLVHLVWQSLDPSVLLQSGIMSFFLMVSSISLYIYDIPLNYFFDNLSPFYSSVIWVLESSGLIINLSFVLPISLPFRFTFLEILLPWFFYLSF